MKKTLVCLVLILSVLFSFTACDSEASPATTDSAVKQYVTGRYELEKIEYEKGTASSGGVLQSAEDVMGNMYVELFSDGTAQLALLGQIHDMEFSEDQMWQIGYTNHTYDFSVSNGKVILKRDGDTYTFVKQ